MHTIKDTAIGLFIHHNNDWSGECRISWKKPRAHCLDAAHGCVMWGSGGIKSCECPCDVCVGLAVVGEVWMLGLDLLNGRAAGVSTLVPLDMLLRATVLAVEHYLRCKFAVAVEEIPIPRLTALPSPPVDMSWPSLRKPAAQPTWEALRAMSVDELAALGCQKWDDSKLMLFPVAWFGLIPDGYEVVTINGVTKPFDRSTASDDRRYGALAFGIVAAR